MFCRQSKNTTKVLITQTGMRSIELLIELIFDIFFCFATIIKSKNNHIKLSIACGARPKS